MTGETQLSLFDLPPVSRASDPHTSKVGERMIASRRPTHLSALLYAYAQLPMLGLTDEQAARRAGITHQSATKRCADLRNAGLIAPNGDELKGSAGMPQRVCVITEEGLRVLSRLKV